MYLYFQTGNNVIDIVDKYGTEQVIYMMAILEVLGIFMIYGLKNICNDFEFMLGYHLNYYWIISWATLPLVLIGIFIFYLVTWKNTHNHPPIAVGKKYKGGKIIYMRVTTFYRIWLDADYWDLVHYANHLDLGHLDTKISFFSQGMYL
jgi:hypothetical protein